MQTVAVANLKSDGVADRERIASFIAGSEGRSLKLHLADGRVVGLAAEKE